MDKKEITNKLKNYLEGSLSEEQLDSQTKDIIKEYFFEQEKKNHWKSILSKEHHVKTFDSINDITPPKNVKFKETKVSPGTAKGKMFGILLILIVIISCLWLFTSNQKSEAIPEQTTIEHIMAEIHNSPMQYRNTKGPILHAKKRAQAYDLYNEKDYLNAGNIFEEITLNESFIEDDHFYLGLCYLYSDQAEDAVLVFKHILKQSKLERKDSSIWFLGLALIESKNYQEAKSYLQQVSEWQGNSGKLRKAKQASQLLDMIN